MKIGIAAILPGQLSFDRKANRVSPFDPINSVAKGVNLLSICISFIIVTGCLYTYLGTHAPGNLAFAGTGILVFYLVLVLNYLRQYEAANVLFYLSLNALTLFASPYMVEPAETMLEYVFLLSLIVFLFEKLVTRVICMALIAIRIILFQIRVETVTREPVSFSRQQESLHWVITGVLLSLIILVFIQYAIKLIRADDLNRKNSHFFQHMSHDVQIAYFSVASICAHLKNAMDTNSTLKNEPALINELMNASENCSYILNSFLEYSKFEKGTLYNNHYEQLDLGSEIARIVELHKYVTDKQGIRIVVDIDETLPELITSDRIKINRIFLNLLSNAIKNTPFGKAIYIKVAPDWRQWRLSVTNEGNGLNEEEVQNLFLPYPAKGSEEGSRRLGLGLPITKDLVEALGGKIMASSKPDKETNFTVAIPFV